MKMKAAALCFLPVALAAFAEKHNCDHQWCGNTNVRFPFGLNESCARNSGLVLSCDHKSGNLSLGKNVPVFNISMENGTMTIGIYHALDCYNKTGRRLNGSNPDPWIQLGQQYTLSDTRNKLTVFGCDTMAQISDAANTFGSGCFSYCRKDINFKAERACSGLGCCQTSIPKSLRSLNITMGSLTNYTSVRNFTSCGSAFVVDQDSFNVSDYKLPVPAQMRKYVFSRAVLDWVVERNLTCEEAQSNQSNYACGANSFCSDFRDGQGYRCFCEAGYTGNPYASLLLSLSGCQDIDECKDPRRYPCHGKCKNTEGNYTCDCPFGMTGDGKVRCEISRVAITAAAIVLSFFGVTFSALLLDTWRRRSKQKNFRRNGGELLKRQRVKIFTEAELAKATNNYDDSNKLGEGGFGSVYRGRVAGDTEVAVKKPKDVHKSLIKGDFHRELETVMQMNHKNVVKLHGICLETRIPLLVYEYISNGNLFQHIHQNASTFLRSWRNRLRIAAEAALALEYMHSCAEPPIIHRDFKSVNILLDRNYSVKVSDFGTSVLISPEHNHIGATEIQGTLGYIDPEYLTTGMLTTKSDVYSFGAVLAELLMGKKPTSFIPISGESINIIHYFISSVTEKRLSDVINFEAASKDELEKVGMVAEIAVKCLDQSSAKRPAMREVAEQLVRINHELDSSTIDENNEETECKVDEENLYSHATSNTCERGQHRTSSSLF